MPVMIVGMYKWHGVLLQYQNMSVFRSACVCDAENELNYAFRILNWRYAVKVVWPQLCIFDVFNSAAAMISYLLQHNHNDSAKLVI